MDEKSVIAVPTPHRKPDSTDGRRRLHAGHFAFFRAYVQDRDSAAYREMWRQHLQIEGRETDERTVQKVALWIQGELIARALQRGRHRFARALRLRLLPRTDASADKKKSLPPPTFDEWLYSSAGASYLDEREKDQIEYYQAFLKELSGGEGAIDHRRATYNARTIKRKLDAILWLELAGAEALKPEHPLTAWLNPDLAKHLTRADIITLQDLADRINGMGRRWHTGVRAIGMHKARILEAWLASHADWYAELRVGSHVETGRRSLSKHQLDQVVEPATAIRPIEKFLPPAELDGSAGQFRVPQGLCLIRATNDYEAIIEWINAKRGVPKRRLDIDTHRRGLREQARRRKQSRNLPMLLEQAAESGPLPAVLSNTQRAYRKEAERLLLWATLERHKPLSSLMVDDCKAYLDFLTDPQPKDRWCSTVARERWSPLWRPFHGALSVSSQNTTIGILAAMFDYLNNVGYLAGNPWRAIARPVDSRPQQVTARTLTRDEWRLLISRLDTYDHKPRRQRLKMLLRLLYATGLRLSEIADAQVKDLEMMTFPASEFGTPAVSGWILNVVGKGERARPVPIPTVLVNELSQYLMARGLSPEIASPGNADVFLIGQLHADDTDQRPKRPGTFDDPPDVRAGLSPNTIYEELKRYFRDCAEELAHTNPRTAAKLQRASTHWLRHTHATHSQAAGTTRAEARTILGHQSDETTAMYTNADLHDALVGIQAFWERFTEDRKTSESGVAK